MGIVIRQSIKGTIVNYIGAFIGFLTTMFVITKYLQPEEIGLTRVLYEAAVFIGIFAQLGSSASAIRFFPYFKSEKKQNNGFFYYLIMVTTIGAIIFIPLLFLAKPLILSIFSKNAPLLVSYFYWVIPLVLFVIYFGALETYSSLLMRIAVPKFIREIAVRLMLLMLYLLFGHNLINMDGYVAGYVAIYGIALLLLFVYVSRIGSISMKHDFSYINKTLRKKFLNYTGFLLLGAFSGSILQQLDLFMVSSQLGLDSAGVYTIAFFIAVIVEIPSRSISSISSPIASEALKEGDLVKANKLYQQVSLHQLIAGSCVFVIVWINIDNIFAIIPNGETYIAGKWVVFYVGLSKLITVTLNFGGTLITFSKYYYWGLFFSLFITIIGFVSNLLLIPRLGITGAAIATLITCILSFSVQQWLVLVKIKGNPFTIGTIKITCLFLAVIGLNLLFPNWSHNPYIDGIYRTFIIGTITLFGLYKLKISEELNRLITNILRKRLK